MIYLSKRAKNYVSKKKEESGNITYIYDEKWVKKRWRKKENKIKALEKNVSKLRESIRNDLTSEDEDTKQIALIISLIDETKERIGNRDSAEENKHYGVSTWLKKHVSFTGRNAKIKYVGKSGVNQEKVVKNKAVVKALKDLLKDKKANESIFDVTPKDVNKYLKKFKISAKDIRGAAANSRLKEELKKQKGKLPKDEKERTKKIKERLNKALESVSKELGHEPSTLKNQYILPKTIETFLEKGKIASKFYLSKRAEEQTDFTKLFPLQLFSNLNVRHSSFQIVARDKSNKLLFTIKSINPHDALMDIYYPRKKQELFSTDDPYDVIEIKKLIHQYNEGKIFDIIKLRKILEKGNWEIHTHGSSMSADYKEFVSLFEYANGIEFVIHVEDLQIPGFDGKSKSIPKSQPEEILNLATELPKIIENELKEKRRDLYNKIIKKINIWRGNNFDMHEEALTENDYLELEELGLVEQIREYISNILPVEYYMDVSNTGFRVMERELPRHNEMGRWLHVINENVEDLSVYLDKFMNIKGEVCFSEPEDLVFHTVPWGSQTEEAEKDVPFLAVVVEGPARAVFEEDVYSGVDELTGRRFETARGVGTPRKEVWISPNETKLVHVVTNQEDLAEEAEEYARNKGLKDFSVVRAGRYTLSKEPFKKWKGEPSFEEEEYWDRAQKFEEGWADDKKQAFYLSKRASKHTTAIVAIKVPEHIVKRLKKYVDEDTQSSNELHITLCFLGKSKDISKSTRKAMISALERVCSNYKPLSMYISGTGRFKKNEDGTPIFLIPNAIGLSRLQADIEKTISNFIDLPSEHGWVPHITVQYAKDNEKIPDLKNFPKWKTDDIVLWFSGNEIAKIPLGKKQAFYLSKKAEELEEKCKYNINSLIPLFTGREIKWDISEHSDTELEAKSKYFMYENTIRITCSDDDNFTVGINGPLEYEMMQHEYSGMSIHDVRKLIQKINEFLIMKRFSKENEEISNWDEIIRSLIDHGYYDFPMGFPIHNINIPEYVRKSLNYFLPPNMFVEIEDYSLSVKERNTGDGPEYGTWMHVVNLTVDSFKDFIYKFKNIDGEICVSDPYDYLYTTRKNFLGILLEGKTTATFDNDVYSGIDPFTGRRITDEEDIGEPRTEGWIVPSKSKIIGIATDIPKFKDEAQEMGYKVYFIGKEGFSRYFEEEEKEEKEKIPWYEFEDIEKGIQPSRFETHSQKKFPILKNSISKFYLSKRAEKIKETKFYSSGFYLSKRAQDLEPKAPGTQILIEPYDSAVSKALSKLPAELKQNVTKIIVHSEGGPGQLGHVEMGPGKDPREIHIFKNRINEQVKKMFGTYQPNAQQLEEATHRALVETLTHEGVHIGPIPQEQILNPSYRFKGESSTEQETSQRMKTLFPEMAMSASLKLDDIRTKYLPSQPMTEPDLEFMIYCALDKKYDTVKKGISLLKTATIKPAILEIKNAIEFNKRVLRDKNVIKVVGALGTCTNTDEVLNLACWQLKNKLEPTGKLDRKTVYKFAKIITIHKLPRNFGIVVSKRLYRGGIIENLLQIKNLKNLGIKRVISLHNHPEIGRMCKKVGIEHIPAPIETGAPEEYGRKILGNKVSKLLLEKPTYIHCWFGEDRTGGVIARFRTETGWSNKDAYLEAKSYGFKDMFCDLIDWFCETGKDHPPVNTRMIRRMLNRLHRNPNCPYRNPEI